MSIEIPKAPKAENEKDIKRENFYCQWLVDNNTYHRCSKTIKILKSAHYIIEWDHRLEEPFLSELNILKENVLLFPDKSIHDIITDIRKFWDSESQYKKYKFVYKRNVLLYGAPGCGKTSIIQILSDMLILQYQGIVINIINTEDVYRLRVILEMIRQIEPERKIIIIIEDLESVFLQVSSSAEQTLINILDGNLRIDKCLIIATTNKPEELEEKIINRPSRFDILHEVGLPNAIIREFYLTNFLKVEDLKKINIKKIVKDTEGYTIDHLKELILRTFVLKNGYNKSLEEVNKILNQKIFRRPKIKKTDKTGFKNEN